MPLMQLSSAVLPAPFGPTSASSCEGGTVKEILDGGDAAEGKVEIVDLETLRALSSTPLPSCSSCVASRGIHDFRNHDS